MRRLAPKSLKLSYRREYSGVADRRRFRGSPDSPRAMWPTRRTPPHKLNSVWPTEAREVLHSCSPHDLLARLCEIPVAIAVDVNQIAIHDDPCPRLGFRPKDQEAIRRLLLVGRFLDDGTVNLGEV